MQPWLLSVPRLRQAVLSKPFGLLRNADHPKAIPPSMKCSNCHGSKVALANKPPQISSRRHSSEIQALATFYPPAACGPKYQIVGSLFARPALSVYLGSQ